MISVRQGTNMLSQPILHTERLLLRPFTLADAPAVQRLLGTAHEIAATTASIPHPYLDGMAEQWIAARQTALEDGTHVAYALIFREGGELIGSIGLHPEAQHRRAELGYWVGVPFWGQGYCTEAAAEILRYGFGELDLHRMVARHFKRNPASGRVMQKIGMTQEGCMRQHFLKWDHYEDIVFYGVLRDEWTAARRSSSREVA